MKNLLVAVVIAVVAFGGFMAIPSVPRAEATGCYTQVWNPYNTGTGYIEGDGYGYACGYRSNLEVSIYRNGYLAARGGGSGYGNISGSAVCKVALSGPYKYQVVVRLYRVIQEWPFREQLVASSYSPVVTLAGGCNV